MTGALAAAGGPVTIVTPTPSRLGGDAHPPRAPDPRPRDRPGGRRPVRRGRPHARALAGAHPSGGPAARRAGVPYLIAAHGMAEPWAMRHKAWKKKIYTALVEGKNLRRAACLHALSRPEIGHLRALAPRTPVCFIPNGVDLEPFDDLPDRDGARGRASRAGGQVRPALLRPDPRQEGARPARGGAVPAPSATIPNCTSCSRATTTARWRRSWTGSRPRG